MIYCNLLHCVLKIGSFCLLQFANSQNVKYFIFLNFVEEGKDAENGTKSFSKNIVVYVDQDEQNEEKEERKSSDMLVGDVDDKMGIEMINDDKPPLPKNKSIDNDDDGKGLKRVSVKDVFAKKKDTSKQPGLPTISDSNDGSKKNKRKDKKPKGMKLKKDKSVFDAFKKEKKPDLSNIKNLPISLKTHLADDSSDHAIQMILDHIRVNIFHFCFCF